MYYVTCDDPDGMMTANAGNHSWHAPNGFEDECSDDKSIAEGKLIRKDAEFPRHHLPIASIMHLTFVKRWYNKREGSVKQSLGVKTDTNDYAFPWCFELLIMIVYASFA
jgi:hypothetical protein